VAMPWAKGVPLRKEGPRQSFHGIVDSFRSDRHAHGRHGFENGLVRRELGSQAPGKMREACHPGPPRPRQSGHLASPGLGAAPRCSAATAPSRCGAIAATRRVTPSTRSSPTDRRGSCTSSSRVTAAACCSSSSRASGCHPTCPSSRPATTLLSRYTTASSGRSVAPPASRRRPHPVGRHRVHGRETRLPRLPLRRAWSSPKWR
jgi:hypothetical protein